MGYKLKSQTQDVGIKSLLNHFNIPFGIQLYQVLTVSPIDIAIGILATKLGLPKIAILLIIAFAA